MMTIKLNQEGSVAKTIKTVETTKTETKSVLNKTINIKIPEAVWTLWDKPWLTGLLSAVVMHLVIGLVATLAVDRPHPPVMAHEFGPSLGTHFVLVLVMVFVAYTVVVCPLLYATRYGVRAAVKAMAFTLLWLALFAAAVTVVHRAAPQDRLQCFDDCGGCGMVTRSNEMGVTTKHVGRAYTTCDFDL
jgi:hypothetical protein